jgi:hypothetical protein
MRVYITEEKWLTYLNKMKDTMPPPPKLAIHYTNSKQMQT